MSLSCVRVAEAGKAADGGQLPVPAYPDVVDFQHCTAVDSTYLQPLALFSVYAQTRFPAGSLQISQWEFGRISIIEHALLVVNFLRYPHNVPSMTSSISPSFLHGWRRFLHSP